MPSATCLRLLPHFMRLAASRIFWTAGSKRPIKTAMMAITTNNSIRVNPRRFTRMAASFSKDKKNQFLKGRSPISSSSLRDSEVESVRPFLDLHFELRFEVELRRNQVLGSPARRRARQLIAAQLVVFVRSA